MGGKSSKKSDDDDVLPVVDATASSCEIVESEEKYDEQEIKNMLNELRIRPERFILDNLLMCMVFFKNYEKDLYDFSNTAIPKEETDLNAELEKEVKSCILPDTLLDKIQENVRFLSQDGKSYERLAYHTVYVVNENIEVKDKTDKTIYTNIEVPGCRVEIEEKDDDLILIDDKNQIYLKRKEEPRYGFIKLRVIKNSSSRPEMDIEERNIDADAKTSESSDTSSTKDQSDEYSTITAFKTPRTVHIVTNSETDRRETLPDSCFSLRKRWKTEANEESGEEEEEEDDEDEEEEEEENESESEESVDEEEKEEIENLEIFKDVFYLSSKEFMEYFQNNIFPNVTGKILGHSDVTLDVKAAPGSILCDKEIPGEKIPFKVIPAVAIDWPKQAIEYLCRKDRSTINDRKHGVVYRWPTKDMVKELVTLKCVAVPRGFVMKKGENVNSDIQWEIHFPKATRYLEVRMTHPQVRCYVFLLTLYKTYIEKVTTVHGLLMEHILTHMFWECERDSRNWPENRLGSKLLRVIEDLNDGLSRSRIGHYFIRKKNVFEDIPSKYIQFAQKAFHDVLQFPISHFIKALKNLKYAHSDFYPAPNLEKLQQILNEEQTRKTPQRQNSRRQIKMYKRRSVLPVAALKSTGKAKVKDEKLKQKREMKNRMAVLDQQKKKEEEEKRKKLKKQEENLKVSFNNMSVITKVNVLQFFINHFIDIAKRSRKIGPKSQTILYLKQAWYNTKVLEAMTYSCEDTQNILKIIEKERENLERKSSHQESQNIAPPTPMRNPEQNCFDFTESKAQLRLKPSFRRNISSEVVPSKNKRMLRRHKSVGFNLTVEQD